MKKKFLSLVLVISMCLLAGGTAFAADISNKFTDPNFLAAVRTIVGKQQVLDTDVNNITYLDVSNRNIKSLAGLEYFTALETFYCPGNQLSSLPTLPSGLTDLNCEDNQLTSLPALPSGLTYFFCGHNQLTSLPALPPGLLLLDCISNQLASLPALPSSLGILNCSFNRLTTLDVTDLNLLLLHCVYNYMTSVEDVKGFKGAWGDFPYSFDPQHTSDFKSVTNIIGAPSLAEVNVPLTISGTVIPSDADNKTIVWSIENSGTSGATVTNGVFRATAAGWVDMRATIADGLAVGWDYEKFFSIYVTEAPEQKSNSSGCDVGAAGMLVLAALLWAACTPTRRRRSEA